MPPTRLLAAALAVTLCGGCATESVYSDGQRLIASGFPEEGLTLLEKAARDNPRQLELRAEWLRQRELAVRRLIHRAETARANGELDDAAGAYRRALRIDPDNPRAKADYAAIDTDRRHAALVRESEALFKRNEFAGAEAKLRQVLAENAGNAPALQLLRRLEDAAASRSVTPPVLKAAIGKPITLEFKEANLRSVFEAISRTSGINFVFDKDVRPDLRTTIVVRNGTVEDVIKLILTTNQLERKVVNENTLVIFPNTPAKLRDYQELVVRTFYLANVDAKQMLNLIRSVVKTRDLYVDEKMNVLVMKDTLDAVRLAEKLIATQDLADPEVTLELEVLEIGSSRLRELGVRFPEQVQFQDPVTVPVAGATATALQRATGPLTGFIATPALLLNLRQQDGTTNVLANPRIRVKNREKARVHIGDRVPVITTTSTANVGVSASVNYLDVGLKLEVEPTIYLEGEVGMKVGLEVSNIVKEVPVTGGGLAYQLGTRNAATVLQLKDGETQVLAGLIQDDERSTVNKLPLIGDLPVVGRLFSSNLDNRNKSEIILLITPRIVRKLVRPVGVIAEFRSGTESAVGAAPLAIAATGPGALALSNAPGAGDPTPDSSPRPALVPPINVGITVPAQAQLGREFTINIILPPHPLAASAEFELLYDPSVLAVDAEGSGSGRATVRLTRPDGGAANAELKFRVVAKAPASTRIRAENLVVRDAGGATVPAMAPPAHSVNLVQ